MLMRCPTCGDRARLYHCGGDRYRFVCGFCGDEGFLHISEREEPERAYERVEEKFQSLREHLRQLFPGKQGEELSEMDVLDLLEEVAERDQSLSLRIWRDVLETASACLQDAETGAVSIL